MNTEYFSMLFGDAEPVTVAYAAGAMLLSFVLTFVYAVVYQKTFNGFSYSRSYIHALVLGGMITCLLIMAVGTSVARGIGLLGTLAIIRFRTPVRDPRDAMFLFACLGTGIACGAGYPAIAVTGTILINLAVLFLHYAPFATRRNYEAMLRFIQVKDENIDRQVKQLILQTCSSYHLIGVRDAVQGGAIEYSYHVRLIDPSYQKDVIAGLKKIEGIIDPVLLMQRTTVEL